MQFKKFKKFAAIAMAAALCVPTFSAQVSAEGGALDTSFDLYSPTLNVNVPVKADIRVNPMSDSTKNDVNKFEVASNSIDIFNATVDEVADVGIPVNVKVNAALSAKEDVVTTWNTFTADKTSATKKIFLQLSQANTAATLGAAKDASGTALTPAFKDGTKSIDLSKYAVATAAEYDSVANDAVITPYGATLSVDIAAPTSSDTSGSFVGDASKVEAKVGSFAVTGVANVSADWKADDIQVDIIYDVRASQALGITTPDVATAPTYKNSAPADATFTVPSVGEATVEAVAVHNDLLLDHQDLTFENVTVDYTTTVGSAAITVSKEDEVLKALGELNTAKQVYDVVVALSDGRMVVTTLTVNAP